MKPLLAHTALLVCLAPLAAGNATAASLMPGFGGMVTSPDPGPGVWYPDRFAPQTFQTLPEMYGRTNVLDIGVDQSGSTPNRPPAYVDTFFDVQGMTYNLYSTGPGVLAADLYIPSSWADSTSGYREAELWAFLLDSSGGRSGFPAIAFSNYGGTPHYQVWFDNSSGAGWDTIAMPVSYNAWTTFVICFNGSTVTYMIDGTPVFNDPGSFEGSTGIGVAAIQAFNFGQDYGANPGPNYDAYWANTAICPTCPSDLVPEAKAAGLVALGVMALIGLAWKREQYRVFIPKRTPAIQLPDETAPVNSACIPYAVSRFTGPVTKSLDVRCQGRAYHIPA